MVCCQIFNGRFFQGMQFLYCKVLLPILFEAPITHLRVCMCEKLLVLLSDDNRTMNEQVNTAATTRAYCEIPGVRTSQEQVKRVKRQRGAVIQNQRKVDNLLRTTLEILVGHLANSFLKNPAAVDSLQVCLICSLLSTQKLLYPFGL